MTLRCERCGQLIYVASVDNHAAALREHRAWLCHPPCSVDGCDKPARARGMCDTHYRRWQTHGDPTVVLRPWGRDALRGGT